MLRPVDLSSLLNRTALIFELYIMASFRHSFLSALLLGAAVFVSSSPVDTSFMPRQASSGFSGCSYPGYTNCNTKDNRGCWVKKGSKTYSIDTDYEDDFPVGITRTVSKPVHDASQTNLLTTASSTSRFLKKLLMQMAMLAGSHR